MRPGRFVVIEIAQRSPRPRQHQRIARRTEVDCAFEIPRIPFGIGRRRIVEFDAYRTKVDRVNGGEVLLQDDQGGLDQERFGRAEIHQRAQLGQEVITVVTALHVQVGYTLREEAQKGIEPIAERRCAHQRDADGAMKMLGQCAGPAQVPVRLGSERQGVANVLQCLAHRDAALCVAEIRRAQSGTGQQTLWRKHAREVAAIRGRHQQVFDGGRVH